MSHEELIRIETLLEEGYNEAEIAVKIERHKTSIYRCVASHKYEAGIFRAEAAWKKIQEKRYRSTSHLRIVSESILEQFIVEKIQACWSPEQTAGRWKEMKAEPLSHETIYRFVYKHHPEWINLYLRRKGKKYQTNRKEKYRIMDRRMIDDRPKSVEERLTLGHWEGDTIIGKEGKGAIITNVERKSGFLLGKKVEHRTAEAIVDSTREIFKDIPDKLKISITYDNGKEFAEHKFIEYFTKMTVYFAHPYSPWERGSNENTNGLLRQFIPKQTDLSPLSDQDLQHYIDLLNHRPRKRLGFKTPYEIFYNLPMKSCT